MKIKKNKKIYTITALVLELVPIITLLLSKLFYKIYYVTEKHELIAVTLEDIAIYMFAFGVPLIGMVLSMIGYNYNKKNLFSKIVMITCTTINILIFIFIIIMILTPWNLGG